jgi:hypothetical protein
MARTAIVLQGQPVYSEDRACKEAITPGHLVSGNSAITLRKHNTANGPGRDYALERDERGQDITVAYASGDTVKVGAFAGGQVVYAWLASGQSVVIDDYLGSNGDGTLKAYSSGPYLGRALEVVDASAAALRIRVEVN